MDTYTRTHSVGAECACVRAFLVTAIKRRSVFTKCICYRLFNVLRLEMPLCVTPMDGRIFQYYHHHYCICLEMRARGAIILCRVANVRFDLSATHTGITASFDSVRSLHSHDAATLSHRMTERPTDKRNKNDSDRRQATKSKARCVRFGFSIILKLNERRGCRIRFVLIQCFRVVRFV